MYDINEIQGANWPKSESKTFDTSTAKGLAQAERYKERLNNKYETVNVYTVGWERVKIVGVTRQTA